MAKIILSIGALLLAFIFVSYKMEGCAIELDADRKAADPVGREFKVVEMATFTDFELRNSENTHFWPAELAKPQTVLGSKMRFSSFP